ncbi:hypothetical protein A4H97_12575 [Niastella yeongjuensis]|uniref:Alginate export domain-containing protein n=1 Tax=Niastella yeongjuensis TaxID=354355 RepID=A0A1V9EA14_9BACT|nr:alginate export family protein [Niastella yeongjuensis]OQP42978.1 hypothetical protein A4H97_12575 [Niastella yeongjuensis]SEO61680.1 Alginate export [Niastella yeongjuensis]
MRLHSLSLVITGMLVFPGVSGAQQFKLLRFNEDYEYLAKDTSLNSFERTKFIPLNAERDVILSFGGEARYDMIFTHRENWRPDDGRNHSLLQRYDLFGNLQWGQRVRIFGQLRSALETGNKFGPAPVDKDQLNVQNLFIDLLTWHRENRSLGFRLGRQEVDYGSGRLVSVSEGTNARRYFTGIKAMYHAPSFGLDVLGMADDDVQPGVFDNKTLKQVNLWGVYTWLIIPAGGNFDYYYLGTHHLGVTYPEGTADETRHTVAIRYWKYGGGFIYNLEAAYQFGKFGTGDINAWTTAIDIGYTFERARFKPTINLRNDYISGDRKKGDGSLQTFNPLYPRGGYFGFNPRIGPANLIDLHPYGTFNFTDMFSLQWDMVFNWRYSLDDGIYTPSGKIFLETNGSRQRYTGTTWLLSMDYAFSKFIKISVGVQYFQIGPFLKQQISEAVDSKYFNAQLTFKF